MSEELNWKKESAIYLNAIEAAKEETKDALHYYRKEKVLNDYNAFLDSVFRFLQLLSFRCEDFPQFYNIVPTEEEDDFWEKQNEGKYFTFNGMWEYLGHRIAVFNDDYGQQLVVKYTKRNGEIVDIGNGCYCTDSGNSACSVNDYICKDLKEEMQEYADTLD